MLGLRVVSVTPTQPISVNATLPWKYNVELEGDDLGITAYAMVHTIIVRFLDDGTLPLQVAEAGRPLPTREQVRNCLGEMRYDATRRNGISSYTEYTEATKLQNELMAVSDDDLPAWLRAHPDLLAKV
jgi:hypothetical protein